MRTWKLKQPRRSANMATPPEGQSWCPVCEQYKALEDFPKNKRRKTGVEVYCFPCRRAYRRSRWWGEQRQHIIDAVYFRSIKRRYGITKEQYMEMYIQQEGKCAICDRDPIIYYKDMDTKHKRLKVDHHHATGKVRGLLCNGCNRGLGFWRENPSVFEKAMLYLQKHSTSNPT